MQLSENRFNVFPCIITKQVGRTISFDELVQKIKSNNPVVDLARQHGKGSLVYDELKLNNLEFFYPNLWSSTNLHNPKYSYGTGYVYLDVDLSNKGEAIKYRSELTNLHPYIFASWLSLSEKGLGILVKVENGGKFYFEQYWKKLNELISGVDPQTKNYNRKCVISYDPDIYINKDACTLDSYFTFEKNSIRYSTIISNDEFENINTPVIYPEGKDVLEINLFKYKKSKIDIGHRNKTMGCIGSILIALNPLADYHQLFNALQSINKNYCSVPLTEKEVGNSLKANIRKYKKGDLDVSGYYTKKFIFWHPECRLNRNERISIGRRLLAESRFNLREKLILDTIKVLNDQSIPVNSNAITEYTLMKKTTFYDIVNKSKKVQNELHYFHSKQYIPLGNNMCQKEKVQSDCTILIANNTNQAGQNVNGKSLSDTYQRIYEALEELQTYQDKINQQRVSKSTGLSLRTIKTYWTPSFKDLVKEYNDSFKKTNGDIKFDPTVDELETENYYRNILNPLTDEKKFDDFIAKLRLSKLWSTEKGFIAI
ncbi:MAG TPA: hypothetical protein DGG95_01850 [Cytophagales bacterium]|nr:hypothetical protein [Cytophagales bacterium]